MKIVITTGIYPPEVGGPAYYAKNLEDALIKAGNQVTVLAFRFEKYLPSGLRHLLFFGRSLFGFIGADFVLILDTFSVAWPSLYAAHLLRKKTVMRIGGDFLWESYVERTGELIPLRDFYKARVNSLSFKEKLIFKITRSNLRCVDHIVFTTDWQRKIWSEPYTLDLEKTILIENYYGNKLQSFSPPKKNFISPSRGIKLKNKKVLSQIFGDKKVINSGAILDESISTREVLLQRVQNSYAVIVPSVSEVSPNLALDALRCNKPLILTKECGLYERLKDVALFVDPLNKEDIKEKILFLTEERNYEEYKRRVSTFTFLHDWETIASEFLRLIK